MYTERFPNKDVEADQFKVNLAGGLLIVLGIVQVVVGGWLVAEISGARRVDSIIKVMAYSLVIEGVLTIACGVGTRKNSSGWALTGLILTSLGAGMAMLSANIIAIIIRAPIWIAVLSGYQALKRIDTRVAKPEQTSPLTQYYHYVIPLLVHIMRADQHIDRRERAKIYEACNQMNLSGYERRRLVEEAIKRPEINVEIMVKRYLVSSRAIGQPSPERKLLLMALSVAEADGILLPQEVDAIHKIGRALGVPQDEVDSLLLEHIPDDGPLNEERALYVLGVPKTSSPWDIESAYQALLKDLDPAEYEHIGALVAHQVKQRRTLVEQAYRVVGQGNEKD